MKTTVIRDKKGNIKEIIQDGTIEEYIAFDMEMDGVEEGDLDENGDIIYTEF